VTEETASGVANWPPRAQIFLDICCRSLGPQPLFQTIMICDDQQHEQDAKTRADHLATVTKEAMPYAIMHLITSDRRPLRLNLQRGHAPCPFRADFIRWAVNHL
jgi:hypothetical protein